MLESRLGMAHPSVLEASNDLAVLLEKDGRHAEAIEVTQHKVLQYQGLDSFRLPTHKAPLGEVAKWYNANSALSF